MTKEIDPSTYVFMKKDKKVRMDQYYLEEHKIHLEKGQPLLFVNRNEGEKIYLPSQECCNASLPENFTKN